MSFLRWLRRVCGRKRTGIRAFPRYCLVGWRVGDEIGRIPMVVRSLSWAEVECERLNAETLQDVKWHIAEIEPDVAIYGRTGLEDEVSRIPRQAIEYDDEVIRLRKALENREEAISFIQQGTLRYHKALEEIIKIRDDVAESYEELEDVHDIAKQALEGEG